MSYSNVHAVFADYAEARNAVESLLESRVEARQFSLFGIDSDAFRDAASPLYAKKFDKLILTLGAVGFVVGWYWGIVCSPHLLPSETMSAFMGGFCGALLGALTAAQAAAALHVDSTPMTDAKFVSARVVGGVMALTIAAKDAEQASSSASRLLTCGGINVSVDLQSNRTAAHQTEAVTLSRMARN